MKYPCLPGLTPDGTVYQNSAMGTVEAMLPPGPWATAHAPALLETPDGSLLCAWFAGSFEGSGDLRPPAQRSRTMGSSSTSVP